MGDNVQKELDFLVYRLKQKDQEALSFLYDQYSANLKGVIYRFVNDDAIADELLQDAFLKIWDKINQYDSSKGRLFTWMLQLTKNIARDYLRSRSAGEAKKTGSLEDVTIKKEKELSGHLSVDSLGLEQVIKDLDKEDREVIELLYLKGYTQSEVAKESDIPLGTVKTRARRAMNYLRTKIHEI